MRIYLFITKTIYTYYPILLSFFHHHHHHHQQQQQLLLLLLQFPPFYFNRVLLFSFQDPHQQSIDNETLDHHHYHNQKNNPTRLNLNKTQNSASLTFLFGIVWLCWLKIIGGYNIPRYFHVASYPLISVHHRVEAFEFQNIEDNNNKFEKNS